MNVAGLYLCTDLREATVVAFQPDLDARLVGERIQHCLLAGFRIRTAPGHHGYRFIGRRLGAGDADQCQGGDEALGADVKPDVR